MCPPSSERSPAELFAALPAAERRRRLASLSDAEAAALAYDWAFWARPAQRTPPGDWRVWLVQAGRGFGKTRTGAEWVREQITAGKRRIALVGPTAADVRDVMIEGESGILAIMPPGERPLYEPSKRRLTFANGAIATAYSADEPNRLRGPQHDAAWADEVAAWQYPDAWDQLMFGLRLGDDPRACATTTPRPKKLIRELLAASTTHVTRGSTYENAGNLAPAFLEAILAKYEGTTLGQQEIYAQLLDETPGALWTRELISANRIEDIPDGVTLARVGEGVDPAVTSGEKADETGIIIGALGSDGIGYVIADLSLLDTPLRWGQRVVTGYHDHDVDRVIGETNNGGDLIETMLRQIDRNVSYVGVRASRGKKTRAEPIAALSEQGRIKFVGSFPHLEDQLCTWTPDSDESPDRLDAFVWTFWWLMLGGKNPRIRTFSG